MRATWCEARELDDPQAGEGRLLHRHSSILIGNANGASHQHGRLVEDC